MDYVKEAAMKKTDPFNILIIIFIAGMLSFLPTSSMEGVRE